MSIIKEELLALSDEQKIQLIHELRDSLKVPMYEDDEDISQEETNILNERLEEYKKNPSSATPWDDFYKAEMNRLSNDKK